ncbi:MAG: TldD/PmbA family protein, partial [Gemmatimonadota bacterium]|nr:TldD/PmbA family protein [Gemmatimonadota bacterium]
MATFFSRAEAQALAQRVLSYSTADEARVNITSGSEGNTRFAQNGVSTSGDVTNASVVVTSAFGKRVASATTNRFDDASLRQVVETSERLARLLPEDPEYLGELGAQQYTEAPSYFESTATLDAAGRAELVARMVRPAREAGLDASGFLIHRAGSQAVATKRGLFAYNASTLGTLTTTVRTPDGTGSGWAGVGGNDWSRVDPEGAARRATQKAQLSRNPRAVEPGRWTVILEPTAVGNLVSLMIGALGARQADEGRSFFARQGGGNRIGDKFVDERVTLYSDPADANLNSAPFTGEGLPNRRMVWVENGRLRNLVYDRFWAQRNNLNPTGFPAGFHMAGGNATTEQMIASTERGLLVTRLWYIRPVDPRT